jgi:type VI secretion system secreted protein VgrG
VDDTTLGSPGLDVPFISPSGQVPTTPHVSAVLVTTNAETSRVTVRDYDFEKPEFILERTAVTSQPLFANEEQLESYSFEVGKFKTDAEGDARAKRLLEGARSMRRMIQCMSSFTLSAGSHFRLIRHPRSDVNGDFLVVRARTLSIQDPSVSEATTTPDPHG